MKAGNWKRCAREERDLKEAYLEHFAEAAALRRDYPLSKYARIPAGAIGMYSYLSRMTQGLQQFMAGARKFALKYIDRNDLVALTEEAAKVSGIPYVMDSDAAEVEKILGYRRPVNKRRKPLGDEPANSCRPLYSLSPRA